MHEYFDALETRDPQERESRLMAALPQMDLTLVIGSYAQTWTFGDAVKPSMTQTVQAWRDYAPTHLPLPHPSWRNTGWLKKNPWFDAEVVGYLRGRVGEVLER